MKRRLKSIISLFLITILLIACGEENRPVGGSGKNEKVAKDDAAAGIGEPVEKNNGSRASSMNRISPSTAEELQKRLGALPIEKDRPTQASWAGPFTDEALNRKIGNAPKDAQLPKLQAAAETAGSAKVIIGLNIPFTPMDMLPESARVAQVATIANAQNSILNALAGLNIQNIKTFSYIPYMAMSVDSAALNALAANPRVSVIEEDKAVQATLASSVPLIGAPSVWTLGYTGAGWSVAVLDTGVDKTHPFLSGKVIAEACYLSGAKCPNGLTSMIGPGAAPDGHGHGTHVSGIAAGNNGTMFGVAKSANIIAVKILDNTGSGWDSDIIRGLDWIYGVRGSYSIASVNMSFGDGSSWATNCDAYETAYKAAIDNLRAANIATVIASGNNSSKTGICSPSCISTAVSVGATNKSDVVASYSQSASILSLLAPGSSIYSSISGGGYTYKSGTSMASPHAAGAWALKKQQSPAASVASILSNLQSTGIPITDTNGIVKKRINLDASSPPEPTLPPVPPRSDGSSPVYRFWSEVHTHHFFTVSAGERDYIIATWPKVWSYERVSYYAYTSAAAGTSPLYRFWSDPYQGHFFTASEAERDYFLSLPHLWTYERIAYYVYNYPAPGTSAVYRFWSDRYKGYFYTISAEEKDYVIATWPNVWSYQGIAFYAIP